MLDKLTDIFCDILNGPDQDNYVIEDALECALTECGLVRFGFKDMNQATQMKHKLKKFARVVPDSICWMPGDTYYFDIKAPDEA